MRPIASQSLPAALESTVILHRLPYPAQPAAGDAARAGRARGRRDAGYGQFQVQADFEAVLPHVGSVHVKDGISRAAASEAPSEFELVPAANGRLPLADWQKEPDGRDTQGAVRSMCEGSGDDRGGTRLSVAYLKMIS